jgi:methanogenic corrinoid protein MtbC1
MEAEILGNLKKAVLEYDSKGAINWAKKAVEEKVDPIKALDALTEAIRKIGDGFGRGELWLPDLVGGGEVMSVATPILEEEIKRRGMKKVTLGTVVIGTVLGDIHNIGKIMVSTFLTAEGFDVYDLGVNISAEAFMEAIEKYNPNILAMSALMTTTAPEQRKVVNALKEKGIRDKIKVMVGGGGITAEFAENIGADGYEPTAPEGAKLARRLVGK